MHVRLLKAKLHQAAVTQTNLNYHGSITIDEDLIDAVGILPHEIVTIGNLSNGQRAETYVIRGERGGRQVQLNGAIARMAHPGDRIIVLAFAYLEPSEIKDHKPKVAVLDPSNRIVETIVG